LEENSMPFPNGNSIAEWTGKGPRYAIFKRGDNYFLSLIDSEAQHEGKTFTLEIKNPN
jgi:hypothetical protein